MATIAARTAGGLTPPRRASCRVRASVKEPDMAPSTTRLDAIMILLARYGSEPWESSAVGFRPTSAATPLIG